MKEGIRVYAALENGRPVAFHDEKKVIKAYCESRKKVNKDINFTIGKISDKKIKKIKDYYDYYLIRLGDSYIQSKYYDIASLSLNQILYDFQYAKDVLYRLIEFPENLSHEELKSLSSAIAILEKRMDDEKAESLDPTTLERMKMEQDQFRYKCQDIYDAENKPWIV